MLELLKEEIEHKLTPRQREVLQLAMEGLSSAQIAKRLGLTQGTVKVHLHNVRKRLRSVLAEKDLIH